MGTFLEMNYGKWAFIVAALALLVAVAGTSVRLVGNSEHDSSAPEQLVIPSFSEPYLQGLAAAGMYMDQQCVIQRVAAGKSTFDGCIKPIPASQQVQQWSYPATGGQTDSYLYQQRLQDYIRCEAEKEVKRQTGQIFNIVPCQAP